MYVCIGCDKIQKQTWTLKNNENTTNSHYLFIIDIINDFIDFEIR